MKFIIVGLIYTGLVFIGDVRAVLFLLVSGDASFGEMFDLIVRTLPS